jgi:hypothetical protein
VKHFCAGLLCVALLGSAQAEDASPTSAQSAATPAALEANPERLGYAVNQPDILVRQRLFGLAHAMSLLAAACLDLPAHSKPIQDAYAAWHLKQGKTIETIVSDLARYYFGARAAEAQWPDLSRALNLKDTIAPALGETTLHAACGSLPAAIVRPRYELDRMLVEGFDTDGKEAPASTASPPAPKSGSPDPDASQPVPKSVE